MRVKVSVVIPVYNVEKYLEECLDSVLNQTLKDIEIICVDDGSKDSCPQILDKYAAFDQRIKVIHKPNAGYGHSMNVGMDAATGEYFAIFESDDVIHPNMYERLYDIATRYDLDIVKADFSRFTIKNSVLEDVEAKIANDTSLYGKVIYPHDDYRIAVQGAALYTWSGIYKLSFLREKGIRHNETPGASYQDNGFWFQTMISASSIYFHNESFYMLRRDNPNSSINSKGKVYCIRDEYEFILGFLEKHPDLYKDVIGLYWWARFGAYRNSYRRIADEFKAEFIQHFYEVMKNANDNKQIQQKLFSKTSWGDLTSLLQDPVKFDFNDRKKAKRAGQNPTKLLRVKWYYEDNGILRTVKHTIVFVIRHFFHKRPTKLEKQTIELKKYLDKKLAKYTTDQQQCFEKAAKQHKKGIISLQSELSQMIAASSVHYEERLGHLFSIMQNEACSLSQTMAALGIRQEEQLDKKLNEMQSITISLSQSIAALNIRQAEQLDEKFREMQNKASDLSHDMMELNAQHSDLQVNKIQQVERKLNALNGICQELIWANIFYSTISNSPNEWLADKTFTPGRAALGFSALYVLYRTLNIMMPMSILELGLGQSTLMISQYAANHRAGHTVVEGDSQWTEFFTKENKLPSCTKIQMLEYDYISYKDASSVRVYKNFSDTFKNQKYNLILVDAPLAYDMTQYARIDVLSILPACLESSFVLLLDDSQRSGETATGKEIDRIFAENNIQYCSKVYKSMKELKVWASLDMQFICSL